MKKQKKRYGVYGLVEWQPIMRIGKARLKVVFSGGAVTSGGVTPATFTTDDPLVQMAIERSDYFKGKRIVLLRATNLDEEVKVGKNQHKPKPQPKGDAEAKGEVQDTCDTIKEPDEEAPAIAGAECVASEEAKKPVSVEFEVNDDAKDYLEREYGAIKSKLRTRADIVAFGKSCGVDIIFV